MRPIKLTSPSFDRREGKAVNDVLRSGWVAHGPKNHEFEAALCAFFGVRHAIAVNSGASALQLALIACAVHGEVIVPSFTMSATVNAVVAAGLKPVFADVDGETGNISPASVAEKITKDTTALMPVHFAGQCCDMDAITSIARRHHLRVIEDAAETCGGRWRGKMAGTFGTAGCLSFWASKAITTGEGGAVLTDDNRIAQNVRTISAHGIATTTMERGKSLRPWRRDTIMLGYNFRLSNVAAAIGVEQMRKLPELNRRRRRHAKQLGDLLSGVDGLTLMALRAPAEHVYQMFVVKVPSRVRDRFVMALRARGIEASVHFDPPVHRQTFYRKNYPCAALPATEKLARQVVTLPLFPRMTSAQVKAVAAGVKRELSALL